MGKSLFIAEKPSVAREFAKALKYNMSNRDGFMESAEAIVTWCVGHLVTISYCKRLIDKRRCGYDLCMYRLGTGRRIYLPAGRKSGKSSWKNKEKSMD